MTAEDIFRAELRGGPDPLDDPHRARRIAAAAAAALGAQGASISVLVAQVRVPFGGSDAEAAHAESIQFSEGEGPCIEAISTNARVDAPAAELTRKWPELARRWRAETSFRSAFSEPVRADGVVGALNVYLTHPEGRGRLSDATVETIGDLVSAQLRSDLYASADTPDMLRRSMVWVALGVLRERHGLSSNEALERARADARQAGRTLDEYAEQLISGSDTSRAWDDDAG